MMRSTVGLADLVTAWSKLGATDDDVRAHIADILGFRLTVPTVTEPVPQRESPPSQSNRQARWSQEVAPSAQQSVPQHSDTPKNSEHREIQVTTTRDVVSSRPSWWNSVPRTGHILKAAPLPAGIQTPAREQEVTLALARGYTNSGPIDTAKVVDQLTRLEIPKQLPRALLRGVGEGLQLLVDRREPMVPFRADVERLAARLRRILATRLEEVGFRESPERVGSPLAEATYRPPSTEVSVLIVGSLDAFGPTAPWLRLHRLLEEADVPLACLCPYDPRRISDAVRVRIPVFYWSPALSTDDIVAFSDARRNHAR